MLEDQGCASERVAIQALGLDALHARLDCVQRLRHIHRDQAGKAAHGKGADGAELLSWRGVRLGNLLEEVVCAEAGCAVCGLTGCCRDEALEEAAETTLAGDDGDGVEEAAQARFGGFAVVDARRPTLVLVAMKQDFEKIMRENIQSSLDTLGWSYSKQRLCNTSTEAGQDGSWARKLAIFISQQTLELVKSNES